MAIHNVILLTNNSDTSLVTANILIKNGKLQLVSTSELDEDPDLYSLDAEGGYLLGNLNIDHPPEFIILKQDPTQKYNVWLDFETNLIFAIQGNVIHRNRLKKYFANAEGSVDKNLKVSWLAYTPPPFALPIRYGEVSKWNYWNTKHFSGVFTAAVGLDRLYWINENSENKTLVNDLASSAGGEIRGYRFGAVGKINFLNQSWGYTLFLATHSFEKGFDDTNMDQLSLFDYRLDIPISKQITMSIGKQKEPISMERVSSSLFNQMQERVSDAFLPGRNIGVQLSGTLLKDKASWAVGTFNPWIEKPGPFDENETVLMSRITGVVNDNGWFPGLLHLGITNRYATGRHSLQYQIKPEFNQAPVFINTDSIETNTKNLVCGEISYTYGPFWVFSEYTHNRLQTNSTSDMVFSSYHITASWVLTGESRTYNRKNGTLNPIPVAKSVDLKGWGAWELCARFSSYNLNSNYMEENVMNIFSLGINGWLTNWACISINYRYIRTYKSGLNGIANGFNTRIMLLLS